MTWRARETEGFFVDTPAVVDIVAGRAPARLVNVLRRAVHTGHEQSYARPGHIPGSLNVPYADLLDPATNSVLSRDDLAARFGGVLADAGPIVTYCGGGITAAGGTLALAALGRTDVAIYDGSLNAWAADPDLPLVGRSLTHGFAHAPAREPTAMKVLWYLSMADGRYPWIDDGFYGVDFDRYRRLAEVIDRGGFYGALVATWPNDPLVSASIAISHTQRMCFLVAVYAGITPAKLLAEQALSFDRASGGRLLFNNINGREERVKTYGITMTPDERYKVGEEFWQAFRQHYSAGNPSLFPNTRFAIDPTQPGGVSLWGTGESPAGVVHAGKVVDVYLLMLREIEQIRDKFGKAGAAAAAHRRRFLDMGALASVVVRRTRSEAEAQFYAMFERTGVERLVAKLNEVIGRRTSGEKTLDTFEAPDPQRREWVDSLRRGRLPALESLRLEHRVFAGITAWSSLDVFGTGSSAAYFVGDPDSIAANVALYNKETGLSALILSGWPLIDEAQTVADLLLPRLAEIG